jgi:hypothetical protein
VYQPSPYTKRPDPATLKECWRLLEEASNAWGVPMAHITSHIRTGPVANARRWLMTQMLDLGLKRCQIAWAFGRDVRRVRRSEIGGPPSPHGCPGLELPPKKPLVMPPGPEARFHHHRAKETAGIRSSVAADGQSYLDRAEAP